MTSLFHAHDLEELASRFPLRDVAKLAAKVARKHADRPFHDPLRVLEAWLERADKTDSDRLAGEAPFGMFRTDGSWAQNGHGDPAMHRFVDMLVTARRREYSVARIAERIMRELNWWIAFPNAATWAASESWDCLPSSTSAERCVIEFGLLPAPEPERDRSDGTYAAFRFGVIDRILADKLTPAQTADLLAQHASKFPDVAVNLDAEIADYRAKGERW